MDAHAGLKPLLWSLILFIPRFPESRSNQTVRQNLDNENMTLYLHPLISCSVISDRVR